MANEKRLIDANALKARFKLRIDWLARDAHDEYTTGLFHGAETDVELIDEIPTVDTVEVVHGRWLFDSGRGRYFCSACNEEALYTTKDEPVYDYDWEENLRYSHTDTIINEHLTNFCPNCGAKMDGDGNA